VGRYVATRALIALPVLFLVTILVFTMIHLAPGDPVTNMVGEGVVDPATIAQLRVQLRLDRPLVVQYGIWFVHALHGDLGFSFRSHKAVAAAIGERLPMTIVLSVLSLMTACALAVPLGILAAVRRNSGWDILSSVAAAFGVAMPAFWLGILLIYVFAVRAHWLPPSGYADPGSSLLVQGKYMVLPAITLASGYAAVVMRLTRSAMLEVLGEDYVRTARAKGVAAVTVIGRHALRNAWLPIITIVGLEFGRLLGGAVVTETIFALPGIGRLAVDAVLSRDYPTLQAVALFMAMSLIAANLVADVVYAALDPRVRYG
jgi:peptide/nickel transport system permease protein